MYKKSMLILFSFLPLTAFGAEFEFSLGAGFQYSGLIGTQFSVKHQDSKYFASIGLPGYSFGMQTIVSDNENHSVGFSLGEIEGFFNDDSKYGFITYNYHVDGFKNSGWVVGTGVGFYDEDPYTPLFGKESTNPARKVMLTFDIGYKF
jgi:hypothetical protein